MSTLPSSPSSSPGGWSLDTPLQRDLAFAVIERVAFGHSLREVEQDPGMPPAKLFLVWVMRNADLAIAYTRAREVSAYSFEDEIIQIMREMKADKEMSANDIRRMDLVTQNWWKVAAKRNPNIFSDKASVQVTVPVQINTTLDLGGAAAAAGTKEFPSIYELKADVRVEVEKSAVIEPELVELRAEDAKPEAKRRRPSNLFRGKRVLVPKPRAAETEVEREARLKAEKRLRDMREVRREQTRNRVARHRAKQAKSKGESDAPG